MSYHLTPLLILTAVTFGDTTADPPDPDESLAALAEQWIAAGWEQDPQYMRNPGDDGWRSRMLRMRELVMAGDASIPPLLNALKHGDDEQRIIAAQTLGYLSPNVPIPPLLDALTDDPSPAVRLYVADAIGMQGGDHADALEAALKRDQVKDVKKHIRYAIERNGDPLDPAVIRALIEWNSDTIDSAEVGQPAPDFALQTIGGETIRLSDFAGKNPVVLVFVYGDT